jgi:SET domain-containing protein
MKKEQKQKTKVKRSSAGLGLFSGEDIKKGSLVIEYTGNILSSKEADARGGKYLFEVNSKKVIDGSGRENKARYINHSCRSNCEIEIKKGRVFVFARKNIKKGEELSYDYGKEYFNEYIKPNGCRCQKCKNIVSSI